MRRFLAPLLFVALAIAPPAGAALAADVDFPDLTEPVPGTEGVTYLDLARRVFPDLESRDGAHHGGEVIETRHLAGAGFAATPPEEFAVHSVGVLSVRADGRDGLALLFDLGESADAAEGFAVLALYDLGSAPVLLDAAQVGFDRSTYFRDPAAVAPNTENDLLLTMSTHFNSNQGYVTSAMITMRDGKLELVDTLFTFDDRGCGYERMQMPQFMPRAGGRPYADIAVSVVEITRHTGEDCGGQDMPAEGTRIITATYRWDDAASRFVHDTDALEILARENEARF